MKNIDAFTLKCSDKIHQAGGVAAPLGGQILSEILPYLEIEQGNPEEIQLRNEITVPNLISVTVEEAKRILKDYKLEMYINNSQEETNNSSVIINQIPQEGVTVYEGSTIYVDAN